MLTIETITDTDGLAALESPWADLLAALPEATVFQTHAWATLYWKHFARRRRLHVLVLKENGSIIGLAPLVSDRPHALCPRHVRLAVLGHGPSDRVNLLFPTREDELTQAMLNHLWRGGISGWEVFDLRGFARESPVAEILCAGLRQGGCRLREKADDVLPFIALTSSWESYFEAQFPAKERTRVRRLWEKLAQHGAPVVRWVTDVRTEPDVLKRIVAMPHHVGVADPTRYRIPFLRPCLGELLADVSRRFSELGWLRIALLEVGGVLAAYRFGFDHEGRHSAYFSAFNSEYADCGPGRLLMNAHLEQCFARGIKEFHFLRGAESYKMKWTTTAKHNLTVQAFRPTPAGRILEHAWRIRDAKAGTAMLESEVA